MQTYQTLITMISCCKSVPSLSYTTIATVSTSCSFEKKVLRCKFNYRSRSVRCNKCLCSGHFGCGRLITPMRKKTPVNIFRRSKHVLGVTFLYKLPIEKILATTVPISREASCRLKRESTGLMKMENNPHGAMRKDPHDEAVKKILRSNIDYLKIDEWILRTTPDDQQQKKEKY